MGNVNMEARQIHVRDNSHKSWHTVADAVAALDNQNTMVQEDITELYTRDSSRASKDDIALDFSAETNYYVGDIVYYEGTLFKCINNHNAGEWDPDDFMITSISSLLAGMHGGLSFYTETHTAQSSANFSHTFARQPKAILQMVQPATNVGGVVSIITPITFDDSGNIINNVMRIIRQNSQITEVTLSWNSSTLALSYSAADWDLAFNRADSKIVYLA
nr:MAG TPA: ChiA1-BD-binding domain protein [Caudoviricetes sp.]